MSTIITNSYGNFNGIVPTTVGGVGTATKYFLTKTNVNFSNGKQSASNYLLCPGGDAVNGAVLTVRGAGDFTIGTGAASSPNVTVALYPVTFAGNVYSGTPTIGSAILSQTFNGSSDVAGYYPFALGVDLQGTDNSGVLQAYNGYTSIDGTAGSFSDSVPLTGVSFASQAPYGLVVGITFSVSDPGAQGNLYEFTMSM